MPCHRGKPPSCSGAVRSSYRPSSADDEPDPGISPKPVSTTSTASNESAEYSTNLPRFCGSAAGIVVIAPPRRRPHHIRTFHVSPASAHRRGRFGVVSHLVPTPDPTRKGHAHLIISDDLWMTCVS